MSPPIEPRCTEELVAPNRHDVRAWSREAWSNATTVREWWRRLAEAGLSQPQWPAPHGLGWSSAEARVVIEELAALGTIAPPEGGVAATLAAPTLLAHGSPDQRDRYLPSIARGLESWCQLFSEPGAGSDLPSLATRAVRDRHGWVVTGQKLWSSNAHLARRGLLLARTLHPTSGRTGISYFVLDMGQPGVEVRPIKQMDGISRFCEVFLDGARVPGGDLIGELHRGWEVARTTLAYERANAAGRSARGLTFVPSGEIAGFLDRRVKEVIAAERHRAGTFTGRAVPARRLAQLARDRGCADDPEIRERIGGYLILTEVNRFGQRPRPSPHPSITKLLVSRICHTSREVSYAVLGAAGMLDGIDAPFGGDLQRVGLGSFGVSIGGGTDEIQRNHLAEQVLGLPRAGGVPETVVHPGVRDG
ncbi:MAG TPA: acyl-CoA dehydrogenase family protein [Acidimicrobiales bacterium]